MSKRDRTRARIFACRDFARDTGTSVSIRLVQPSPTDPLVRRTAVLTFQPGVVYLSHGAGGEAVISIQQASRMADHWQQEVY